MSDRLPSEFDVGNVQQAHAEARLGQLVVNLVGQVLAQQRLLQARAGLAMRYQFHLVLIVQQRVMSLGAAKVQAQRREAADILAQSETTARAYLDIDADEFAAGISVGKLTGQFVFVGALGEQRGKRDFQAYDQCCVKLVQRIRRFDIRHRRRQATEKKRRNERCPACRRHCFCAPLQYSGCGRY